MLKFHQIEKHLVKSYQKFLHRADDSGTVKLWGTFSFEFAPPGIPLPHRWNCFACGAFQNLFLHSWAFDQKQPIYESRLNQGDGDVPLVFHFFYYPMLSYPCYERGALAWETTLAPDEEWCYEDDAQSLKSGSLHKTYPLQEAQTPRQKGQTRVQSWRLQWLEEVG